MVTTVEKGLTKPKVYEIRKLRLRSPLLHIGSETQQLSPFEYVQTAGHVYLPDRDRLARTLQKFGRLDDYIHAIEARHEITPVLKAAFGPDWTITTDDEHQALFPEQLRLDNWVRGQISDLRPMIRNGFGQLYIPGSSIKGAIRTAIAYHLIKHSHKYNVPKQYQTSAIESVLRQKMGELKSRAKFIDDDLFMKSLFEDFSLTYQGQVVRSKTGPNTDWLRALKVSDTEPLVRQSVKNKQGKKIPINLPAAVEVLVSSYFEEKKAKHRASLYVEMIRNVNTTFTLSLDTEMLSWFKHYQGMEIPFQTLDELLAICQEFAQDQWDHEHDYWQAIINNPKAGGKNLDFEAIREIYNPKACPFTLRLGWATGFTGTTISLELSDLLRAKIRDAVGIRAPGFEAPKSRRTVLDPRGEIKFVPGWAKLS